MSYINLKRVKRFWKKAKIGSLNECWEWIKHYGRNATVRWNGPMEHAPRVAYRLAYGEIPEGLCVCHSCDNPICVNPSHLWLGTQLDNMRDMKEKGRARAGIVKMTEEKTKLAQHLRSLGYTYRAIGKEIGVAHNNVMYALKKICK